MIEFKLSAPKEIARSSDEGRCSKLKTSDLIYFTLNNQCLKMHIKQKQQECQKCLQKELTVTGQLLL